MAKKKKDIWKIILHKDYSITGKEQKGEFKSQEELKSFLEKAAYDSNDEEIKNLIENGGDYIGLKDTEFTIEVPEKEIPIEQTSFNNAEMFLNEYEHYLIGKKVIFDNGDKIKITGVRLYGNENNGIGIQSKEYSDIILLTETNDFQDFIDGNPIGKEGEAFHLILQDEIEPELYNKPEYKYYVILGEDNPKILSGFEYKEDAEKEKERKERYGHDVVVKTKKELSGVNLDDNNIWSVNEHDWNIIEAAINMGVEEKDFSETEGAKYLNGFKGNGTYVTLVKSLLLKALGIIQKQSWKAYLNSNIEKATEKNEIINRINKELVRVIEIEK